MVGNGANFTDGGVYAANQTFAQLEFTLSGTTISVKNRAGTTLATIAGLTFHKNTTYEFELYLNNGIATTTYTRNSIAQSVPINTFDLWINNVLAADNLAKGSLAANTNINSFMFYGLNSTDAAAITLDDIAYSNYTVQTTLPVEITAFNGSVNSLAIDLNWTTTSEKDNSDFELLRSSSAHHFMKIATIKGAGHSSVIQNYSYQDVKPLPGINYYQLKQIDLNGAIGMESAIIAVRSAAITSHFKVSTHKEKKLIELTIYAANDGNATLKIYDLNGRRLFDNLLKLSKGYQNFSFPSPTIVHGLHIATLTTGNEKITNKFIY